MLHLDNTVIIEMLTNLANQLNHLEKRQKEYEPIWDKAGEVYELVVRKELAELRGSDYARSFDVVNLEGLARLCLPKHQELTSEGIKAVEAWSSRGLQTYRINVLAKIADENLEALRNIVSQFSGNKKYNLTRIRLSEYDALSNDVEKTSFLSTSSLGLQAFSITAFEGSFAEHFISSVIILRFSCRGFTFIHGGGAVRRERYRVFHWSNCLYHCW